MVAGGRQRRKVTGQWSLVAGLWFAGGAPGEALRFDLRSGGAAPDRESNPWPVPGSHSSTPRSQPSTPWSGSFTPRSGLLAPWSQSFTPWSDSSTPWSEPLIPRSGRFTPRSQSPTPWNLPSTPRSGSPTDENAKGVVATEAVGGLRVTFRRRERPDPRARGPERGIDAAGCRRDRYSCASAFWYACKASRPKQTKTTRPTEGSESRNDLTSRTAMAAARSSGKR